MRKIFEKFRIVRALDIYSETLLTHASFICRFLWCSSSDFSFLGSVFTSSGLTFQFIMKNMVLKKKKSNFFKIFFDAFLGSIVLFICSLARSFDFFSNNSWRRRNRFDPKIIRFRAILAISRPFEDFGFLAFAVHN